MLALSFITMSKQAGISRKNPKARLLLVSFIFTFSGLFYMLERITRTQHQRVARIHPAQNASSTGIEPVNHNSHSRINLSYIKAHISHSTDDLKKGESLSIQTVRIFSSSPTGNETETQFFARMKKRMEKRRKHLLLSCQKLGQ